MRGEKRLLWNYFSDSGAAAGDYREGEKELANVVIHPQVEKSAIRFPLISVEEKGDMRLS